MMSPKQFEKLNAAFDFVAKARGEKVDAGTIIAGLVGTFGASHVCRSWTNTLRCAGVSGTCAWSKDEGLLNAWKNNALVRIMRDNAP